MNNDKIQARIEALNSETKEKLMKCKSKKELLDCIAESNMELSDDELSAVAGGNCCSDCAYYDFSNDHEFDESCAYECGRYHKR